MSELRLATAAEMREIDRVAIEEMGIAGAALMERAGEAVAAALIEESQPFRGRRVVVVAGKGNNGGDGFVVARRLLEAQAVPMVALLGSRDDVRGDAAGALRRAEAAGVVVRPIEGAPGTVGRAVAEALGAGEIAVDALLGTGASGAPRGVVAEAIAALESFAGPVVSIDIPSGVDATTGAVPGRAVRAALTVTLGLAKPGLYLYPGRAHAGKIVVADIGIPPEAVARVAPVARIYDWGALRLPERAPDAHKGQVGRVLVAGGSPGLTGCVYMAGMAALRAGAGLVTLAVPRSMQPILATKATELMTLGLPETKSHRLGTPAARELIAFAEGFDALALGPGLSRAAEVRAFVGEVVDGWTGRMVLDADGLWVLANGLPRLAAAGETGSDIVVTPHVGEAIRLSGEERETILADRVAAARRGAASMKGTYLLKGNPTIVADRDGAATLNPSGGRGLATAGSGDVLTGIIAGLLGQGMDGAAAARAGAYLHGRAGDSAEGAIGFRSMVAGDVLDQLPRAVREVDERA